MACNIGEDDKYVFISLSYNDRTEALVGAMAILGQFW